MRVIEGMHFTAIVQSYADIFHCGYSVDGTDVEEYGIDLVTLSVAQRVSVLVTARNDTAANWLIHANMVSLLLSARSLPKHSGIFFRVRTCLMSFLMTYN